MYYNFLCYEILIILFDNDVNKVHLKLPLDTYLICLKFFLQYDVIIRIGFLLYFRMNLNRYIFIWMVRFLIGSYLFLVASYLFCFILNGPSFGWVDIPVICFIFGFAGKLMWATHFQVQFSNNIAIFLNTWFKL